jgi:hypothetical protein
VFPRTTIATEYSVFDMNGFEEGRRKLSSEQFCKLEVTMDKKNFIPMASAAFIAAVGLMFLGAVLIDLPPLKVKSPENYVLAGVAVFFLLFGCVYGYVLATGNLAGNGRTITEVRQEAIQKMRDQTLLARMATEDPDKQICKAAEERLQEIASYASRP